ncbi:MAG: peptide-methionine (S)-S-oxide reductase MsrA [Nanoarchaeota archaeon]|nr:peptide-methionine (S)-S-oxide reductase MsrA [Nanoarchaeota archaeon]
MKRLKKAIFAGGCFWCTEAAFSKVIGVESVISGYSGGNKSNPTYYEVSSGATGHFESVLITYDEALLSYSRLLELFWINIDPFDENGQFFDRGSEYRTAIFHFDEEQRTLAENSLAELKKSKKFNRSIATKILPAKVFYPAEENHQEYKRKNPFKYNLYRMGSGRDRELRKIWNEN